MKYTEFEISAKRHLESCYHILENLAGSSAAYKKQREDRLILTIYYLSGYTIECSLKFAFFKAIHASRSNEIVFSHTILGTAYDLKTHKLTQLVGYLSSVDTSLPRDIPMITQVIHNSEHKILANKWNSEIRYSPDYARINFEIDATLIRCYLDDVVKPIFEKLTRR